MNRYTGKMAWIFAVICFFAITNYPFEGVQEAYGGKYRSKSSSSRSFSKKSSAWKRPSTPSKSVWGQRSGGGIYGSAKSASSSGYKKPSSKTSTSQGYAKPQKKTASSSSDGKPKASSSGYAKPLASTSAKSKPKTASASGYAKPKDVRVKKNAFSGKSGFDKKKTDRMKKEKAAASLASYKKENNKFKPATLTRTDKSSYKSNPIYKKSRSYSDFDYRTHYSRRNDYYKSRKWHAPKYVYLSRPSFGMWDAMILWAILDNLNDPQYSAMAHHHANDPGYQEWRKEAERLAQNDEELSAKLAKLDQQTLALKDQPRNADYLPDDLPPEVAIAADVMAQKEKENPDFKLATASETGNYYYFGTLLKQHSTGLNIELLSTQGSMENLNLLVSNKVDGAIVQSDAFNVFKQKFPKSKLVTSEQTKLYVEALQMIANKDSGIKNIKGIKPDGKHILYIGPAGSGTAMTWEGLCAQDKRYRKIKVKNADYATALKAVITNPKAVMMFVSGLNSKLLRDAEKEAGENKSIRLVEVDDWDFNDARDEFGNRVYEFVSIPSSVYPNLQKGFVFNRDITTLAVDALLIVRTDWVSKYGPETLDALSFAVMEAQPLAASRVNGLK